MGKGGPNMKKKGKKKIESSPERTTDSRQQKPNVQRARRRGTGGLTDGKMSSKKVETLGGWAEKKGRRQKALKTVLKGERHNPRSSNALDSKNQH